MKSIYALLFVSFFSVNAFAQDDKDRDEEKPHGFKKENLFAGGSLNVSLGNQQTALGLSPVFFGYSINRFVDVAVSAGYNYISERQYDYYGNRVGKIRQSTYGPGAFVRVFPVKFIYLQGHYEYNKINLKYIYNSNTGLPTQKYHVDASSFLVGAGYAAGREDGEKSYFYISIMFDLMKSTYSPYRDYQDRAQPIIRAGYNIALFQNRIVRRRRSDN